ncbi:hypothetical protein [Corynebacterium spheniscorum]|uniref:Uncharacterized protein n=1 Tax=Corynebacterium spheniscorum TaxID=185761 RepID=A0A1I2QTB2_9CORY|nr:hypothetical protein [Corynebacterium spheniscorum]KAA8719391.1 hypothetical protein F4V56_10245 [Corynebacterium spheniscorum]SFG28871.1 hypothetical protein SAMN05660282_00504 [Corynebacterium spheniscorum]
MATTNSSGNSPRKPSGNSSGNSAEGLTEGSSSNAASNAADNSIGDNSATSTTSAHATSALANPKNPLRVSAVWTTVIYLILGLLSAVFIWVGTPTPDSHARVWNYDIPSANGEESSSSDTAPGNGLGVENPTRSAGELFEELNQHSLALFIEHQDALAAGLTVLDPTGQTPWLQEHRDELAPQPGKARAFLFRNTYCAKQVELGNSCPYLPDNIEVAGTTDSPISPRGRQFAIIPAAEDTLGYGRYLIGGSGAEAKEILPEVFVNERPYSVENWFGDLLVKVLEYEGTLALIPLIIALLLCIFIFAMEYRRNTNFPEPTRSPASAKSFAFAHFPAHIAGYLGGIIIGLLPLVWVSIHQGNEHVIRAYLPNAVGISVALILGVLAVFTVLRFLIARHYLRRLMLLNPGATPNTTTTPTTTNPQGGAH